MDFTLAQQMPTGPMANDFDTDKVDRQSMRIGHAEITFEDNYRP